jgi:NAD(P)-dependent dehydrogenase (short-subunit alcohol dehydrogenase family)
MNRIGDSLSGKRVLITQAGDFMGPALREAFTQYGADVIADEQALTDPDSARALVEQTGRVDVLIANLACPAPSSAVHEVTDDEWRDVFAHMVDPLPRLFAAVTPGMAERGGGKIIVMGSATALRGQKRTSTYSAARGAQVAYVRAAGAELARDNIQANLIAQHFVDNPTYFPPEVQALEAFKKRLAREVPAGRLGTASEDALFAVFLASDEVSFFVGQSFPFAGGWAA